jgi:hypothetical protein
VSVKQLAVKYSMLLKRWPILTWRKYLVTKSKIKNAALASLRTTGGSLFATS